MKGGVAIIPVGFRLDLVGVAAFCRQMYVDLCGMTKKPDSRQDTVYSCPEILGVATSRLVGCFAMGISARSSETAVGPSNTSHESGRETGRLGVPKQSQMDGHRGSHSVYRTVPSSLQGDPPVGQHCKANNIEPGVREALFPARSLR